MATFTFDTAYLVAHLQNNANEALKQRIRERRLAALDCALLHSDLNRYQFFLTCALLCDVPMDDWDTHFAFS